MLEDNRERIAAFRAVVSEWPGCELVVWRNAPEMMAEMAGYLPTASLISLDHDLIPDDGEPDPGDGLEVAEALASHAPTCPVIVHSTNIDRVYSMIRELTDGGWTTHRVAPYGMGEDWIPSLWAPSAKGLLGS